MVDSLIVALTRHEFLPLSPPIATAPCSDNYAGDTNVMEYVTHHANE
jgi:hypothetical protein